MDSSLPVLVSRVADRHALARLVQAALRHEVAEVELASPLHTSGAYTLDLHVPGLVPVPLYAELAGPPRGNRFPLRLRPLYRAQIPQLYALLEHENAPLPSASPPSQPGPWTEPSPSQPASSAQPFDPRKTEPRPFRQAPARPPQHDDPRKTVPLGAALLAQAMTLDPRRTAPSAFWTAPPAPPPASDHAPSAPAEAGDDPTGEEIVDSRPAGEHPADDDDRSVAMQVVFEPDLVAALLAGDPEPSFVPSEPAPDTAETDPPPETTLEREELPKLGLDDSAPSSEPPHTIAGHLPPALEESSADDSFFDAALANLPFIDPPEVSLPPASPAVSAPVASPPRVSQRPPRVSLPPPRDSARLDAMPGRRLADGKYEMESLLGSGATGSVYRAKHRELRRTVAIKVLHPHYQQDPQFMAGFRAEALAASQLDHPNVTRVLDFGQDPDGLVYIVMEYLSGRTLQSVLDEEQRIPATRALEIMVQVCAALSVAHDHGIIHRDVKPENIMLVTSRNDEGKAFELVKVCDFGIAALKNPRAEDAHLAFDESIIAGTPEYMSPEQARGNAVDARSDVYACGICLYELVTGRVPFLGTNPGEVLIKQIEETPRPPSLLAHDIDPILEEVILRAIQKLPSKRHQSARELRVELKELAEPDESFDDDDERSVIEHVPVLDDPASGFPGFFIAFASAALRVGRFEHGHPELSSATKELHKAIRTALRGRGELTFARRDVPNAVGFCAVSGTAEIADLRRLLGSQIFGSFGERFTAELVRRGIAAITLREGVPDPELHYLLEVLQSERDEDSLRAEIAAKPLRSVSVLFASEIVGKDRQLAWKVGLCVSRLARDLSALGSEKGLSLKKMREARDELIGSVARLLTRGDEVRQLLSNADLVDDAVASLRGFSAFRIAPLVLERISNEACASTAMLLLADADAGVVEPKAVEPLLERIGARLATERSPASDAAVGELHRRGLIELRSLPDDLQDAIKAQALADTLARDPAPYLRALEGVTDGPGFADEVRMLETAIVTLARRSEAAALLAVMAMLARHARGPGPRAAAALGAMRSLVDRQRLMPIATTLLVGAPQQREAARQLIVLAGSAGAEALYAAREAVIDPSARATFVRVFRETGPAGWSVLSQALPRIELTNDAEVALVEDLLRTTPDHADAALGESVSKFLGHPRLRAAALQALAPLWGERARKPLFEALEYADEPVRIVALRELRWLSAVDEQVIHVIERFLLMRGSAGEELRAAAAAALADAPMPQRPRAVQLLVKTLEGRRGLIALLRGDEGADDSELVIESAARALLSLDRAEGVRVVNARLARSEGSLAVRLSNMLRR